MARYELREFVPKSNYITATHSTGDLTAFGEEIYQKYKDVPCFIQRFQTAEGSGFAVYICNEQGIVIQDIEVTDSKNEKSKMNILEDIIYAIRNIAASNKTKLVIETDNADVDKFIKMRNNTLEDQGVEGMYHWKIAR